MSTEENTKDQLVKLSELAEQVDKQLTNYLNIRAIKTLTASISEPAGKKFDDQFELAKFRQLFAQFKKTIDESAGKESSLQHNLSLDAVWVLVAKYNLDVTLASVPLLKFSNFVEDVIRLHEETKLATEVKQS